MATRINIVTSNDILTLVLDILKVITAVDHLCHRLGIHKGQQFEEGYGKLQLTKTGKEFILAVANDSSFLCQSQIFLFQYNLSIMFSFVAGGHVILRMVLRDL
jgi:hypothetical protein